MNYTSQDNFIKTFSDINAETLKILEDNYYPHFDGDRTRTLDDIFNNVKHLVGTLGESAVRKNMKARYTFRHIEVTSDDEILRREQSLQLREHRVQRKSLVTNHIAKQYADTMLIIDELINSPINTSSETLRRLDKEFNNIDHILISDVHFGNQTVQDHEQLFKTLARSIKDNVRHNNITLTFAGDTLDGIMRLSQVQQLKLDAPDQVLFAIETIVTLVKTLINSGVHVCKLNYIDIDNHGEIRPFGSQRGDLPQYNFNRIVSGVLSRELNKINVPFERGEQVKIGDFTILHGHQFKGKNAVKSIVDEDNKLIVGHFHTFEVTDNYVMLPALTITDTYAKSLGIKDTAPAYVIYNDGWFKKVELK